MVDFTLNFCSQRGDPLKNTSDTECPVGWEWTNDWHVDTKRPVDSDGKMQYDASQYNTCNALQYK